MSRLLQQAAGHRHAGTLPFGPPTGRACLHWPAPVAQGIEHRPPEAGARVRISPGALIKRLVIGVFPTRQRLRVPVWCLSGACLRALLPEPRPLHQPRCRANRRTGGRTGRASSSPTCGPTSAEPSSHQPRKRSPATPQCGSSCGVSRGMLSRSQAWLSAPRWKTG
jgi:hypothetical protein